MDDSVDCSVLAHAWILYSAAVTVMTAGLWGAALAPVAAQASKLRHTLRPACVAMVAPGKKPAQTCCPQSNHAQCVQWQHLFPTQKQKPLSHSLPPKSSEKPQPVPPVSGPSTGAVLDTPYVIEDRGKRSATKAESAVIQMGVQAGAAVVFLPIQKVLPNVIIRSAETAQKIYTDIFGPKQLKSGAVITPTFDFSIDPLNDFEVESAAVGAKLKF